MKDMSEKNCCQLCGGALNRGYCPACGFYAKRKDKIHYRLNESNASRRLDARYGEKLEKQLERREKSHQRLHNDFKGTSSEIIKARREAEALKKTIQQGFERSGIKEALNSEIMAGATKGAVQSARNVMSTLQAEIDQKLLASDSKPATGVHPGGGYQTSSATGRASGTGTARSNSWNTNTAKRNTYGVKDRPLNTMQSKTSKKGIVVGIVVIAIFLSAVLSVIGQFAFELPKPWTEDSGGTYGEPAQYEPSPDKEVNTLAETGDDYVTLLTGGNYIVGVHIPEGLYTVNLADGSGSLDITDNENDVFIYKWFEISDEENEEDAEEYGYVTELTDVTLFAGAHITVYPEVVLSFETHNGQTAQMAALENPLKDVFNVPKGTTLVCGVDFEPGVYDIQGFSNNGLLFYTHPYSWSDDGEFYEELLWLDEGVTYKNLVLLDGAEIYSDDANFTLLPSPEIGNIDYDTYYDYE